MIPDFLSLPTVASAFKLAKSAQDKAAASTLRSELLKAREQVQALLDHVPEDCRGLTIHDVTHLDALWDMADMLIGGNILNPAEVFVLGCAILLHDAGLTATAYPNGVGDLSKTDIWRDYKQVIIDRRQVEGLPFDDGAILDELKFSTLRELHASKASELATQAWLSPKDGSTLFIIESEELRSNYGSGIGRVAASHHWDVSRLYELRESVGASPGLPQRWVVNERKLAALLRVADITHIDKRRAPTMHYAVARPTGVSDLHWRFQNKIAKPSVRAGVLTYSGEDFRLEEAPSWWVAYDTINMIERELVRTNAALLDFGLNELSANRVLGANNPNALAKYIPTRSWSPVDASVRVSDPSHLAATLGGRNLYGAGIYAPLRELLQNSADAIRARRVLEGRGDGWGSILVELSKSNSRLKITIFDNGVGMSESVMTGPLIDFGKSLWRSDLLLREHPGLAGKRPKIIGRYGIGFFSVFGISETTTVLSRKYDAGVDQGRELVFGNVATRPILTVPDRGKVPVDYNTVVTVVLSPEYGGSDSNEIVAKARQVEITIMRMVTDLNIELEVNDLISGKRSTHKNDMYKIPSSEFLRSTYDKYDEESTESKKLLRELLRPIFGSGGRKLGRAALNTPKIFGGKFVFGGTLLVSADGFSGSEGTSGYLLDMIGLMSGDHVDISRNKVMPSVTYGQVQNWLDGQIEILLRSGIPDVDLAKFARSVVEQKLDPKDLPFISTGQKFLSSKQLAALALELGSLWIPVASRDEGEVMVIPPGDFSDEFAKDGYDQRVVFPATGSRYRNKILSAVEAAKMQKVDSETTSKMLNGDVLSALTRVLSFAWGDDIDAKVVERPVLASKRPYRAREHLVLELARPPRRD